MAQQRATSFGEVAGLYDAARPSYPGQLVQDVLNACAEEHPRVLDVGCGTGIAAAQFVEAGCELVGLEPDALMASFAAERLEGLAEICLGRFEEVEFGDGSFDCLIAAQAWHWFDPLVAYELAHRLLKPDGVLALFWNVRVEQFDPLTLALEDHYRLLIPSDMGDLIDPQSGRRSEAEIALNESYFFSAPEVLRYRWGRTCNTSEYLNLMSTHSVIRLMEPTLRRHLLDGVRKIVNEQTGSYSFGYETVMLLSKTLDS